MALCPTGCTTELFLMHTHRDGDLTWAAWSNLTPSGNDEAPLEGRDLSAFVRVASRPPTLFLPVSAKCEHRICAAGSIHRADLAAEVL